MLLALLLASVELLKSAPKIIAFTQYVPSACKKLPFQSKPMPYPEYLYLLISAFFVILTAPNKEFFPSKTGLTSKRWNLFHKQCKCLLFFHDYMLPYFVLKNLL